MSALFASNNQRWKQYNQTIHGKNSFLMINQLNHYLNTQKQPAH